MLTFDLHQWAVGQGAFYSATVRTRTTTQTFVYDCGSTALKTDLHPAIERFRQGLHKEVAAVFVSHWDYDHICGIPILSESCDVSRLFVPECSHTSRAIRLILTTPDGLSPSQIGWVAGVAAEGADALLSPDRRFETAIFDITTESSSEDQSPPNETDLTDAIIWPFDSGTSRIAGTTGPTTTDRPRRQVPSNTPVARIGALLVVRPWRNPLPNHTYEPHDIYERALEAAGLTSAELSQRLDGIRQAAAPCRESDWRDLKNSIVKGWKKVNEGSTGTKASTNDSGVVLYVGPPHNSPCSSLWGFLGIGDICFKNKASRDRFLQDHSGLLECMNVVQAPHHGSARTWSTEWRTSLPAVRAWLISSSPVDKRYRHPRPAAVASMQAGRNIVHCSTKNATTDLLVRQHLLSCNAQTSPPRIASGLSVTFETATHDPALPEPSCRCGQNARGNVSAVAATRTLCSDLSRGQASFFSRGQASFFGCPCTIRELEP